MPSTKSFGVKRGYSQIQRRRNRAPRRCRRMSPDDGSSETVSCFGGPGGLLSGSTVATQSKHMVIAAGAVEVDVKTGVTENPFKQGVCQLFSRGPLGRSRKDARKILRIHRITTNS